MSFNNESTTAPQTHAISDCGKAPGPGSIMWDTFSDLAVSPFAVAVLIMQAAHPDVGAAVGEYSIYTKNPWGRLFRTGFSMMRFLYGGKHGKQSMQEAKELRTLHASINGKRPDGTVYRALSPQTFRIVPDTFLDAVLRLRTVLGKPLNETERNQLYDEYINLCLLFGIPRQELESNLDDFLVYYDKLLLDIMNYNPTVAFLLGDMMMYGPAMKYLPIPETWRRAAYKRTVFPLMRLFTIGFLDPRFRDKHAIPWSDRDERHYQRGVKIVRVIAKIVPRFLRYHPFALYVMLGGHGVKLMTFERLMQLKNKH